MVPSLPQPKVRLLLLGILYCAAEQQAMVFQPVLLVSMQFVNAEDEHRGGAKLRRTLKRREKEVAGSSCSTTRKIHSQMGSAKIPRSCF